MVSLLVNIWNVWIMHVEKRYNFIFTNNKQNCLWQITGTLLICLTQIKPCLCTQTCYCSFPYNSGIKESKLCSLISVASTETLCHLDVSLSRACSVLMVPLLESILNSLSRSVWRSMVYLQRRMPISNTGLKKSNYGPAGGESTHILRLSCSQAVFII